MTPDTCEHKWVYAGIVYELSEHKLPGSGAHRIIYSESFFCERCLGRRFLKLPHSEDNSYSKPNFNATPKPPSK